MAMDARLYDVHEVAQLLQCTERTVRNYLRAGYLHGTKTPRRWLFSEEDLNEFLTNGMERGYSAQIRNRAEIVAAGGESGLSSDEASLLALYRSMSDEGQSYLMRIAETTERSYRDIERR